MEIIKQRLEEEPEEEEQVNVIVEGKTYKCKPHALQHCNEQWLDEDGNLDALVVFWSFCKMPPDLCDCAQSHAATMEDLVNRMLRRLEDDKVSYEQPPFGTELYADSYTAVGMGLFPRGFPPQKWFCDEV